MRLHAFTIGAALVLILGAAFVWWLYQPQSWVSIVQGGGQRECILGRVEDLESATMRIDGDKAEGQIIFAPDSAGRYAVIYFTKIGDVVQLWSRASDGRPPYTELVTVTLDALMSDPARAREQYLLDVSTRYDWSCVDWKSDPRRFVPWTQEDVDRIRAEW